MTVIKLSGPGLNQSIAEQIISDCGPELARQKCTGPMLDAVNRAIEARKARTLAAWDDLQHEEQRADRELLAEVRRSARNRL